MGVRIVPVAAVWGTTVCYTEYYDTYIIERTDGNVKVVYKETFEYLYHKLDKFTAALKEDCIEYAINDNNNPLTDYPEWYLDARFDGVIYSNCAGTTMLYEESGEIAMSPNSIVLRNFKGELRHIEAYKFHQYYDILEE